MNVQGCLVRLGLIFKVVLIAEAVILPVIGVFCWATEQRSMVEFAQTVQIAAALIMAVGLISGYGGWRSVRSAGYQYVRTAGPDDLAQRLTRDRQDLNRTFGFMAWTIIIGVVTLFSGIVLQLLFT